MVGGHTPGIDHGRELGMSQAPPGIALGSTSAASCVREARLARSHPRRSPRAGARRGQAARAALPARHWRPTNLVSCAGGLWSGRFSLYAVVELIANLGVTQLRHVFGSPEIAQWVRAEFGEPRAGGR